MISGHLDTYIDGYLTLWHAAQIGCKNVSILKNLLPSRYDPNFNISVVSAIRVAAINNHITTVQILLEISQIDINTVCPRDENTLLGISIWYDNTELAQYLLSMKACIDGGQILTQSSPLINAVTNGKYATTKMLLDLKASINASRKSGITAIHIAAELGLCDQLELLIKSKAYVNSRMTSGVTPLILASVHGDCDTIRRLVYARADVDSESHGGRTPMSAAARSNKFPALIELINAKSNINKLTRFGTPLHTAAEFNSIDAARVLLHFKANITLIAPDGLNPMHYAVIKDNQCILELLIQAKSDVNSVIAPENRTALHLTAVHGYCNTADMLLNAKANPNLSSRDGATPIYFASKYNRRSVLDVLIESKGDINIVSASGVSPIYIAIYNSFYGIARDLIKAKADVNIAVTNTKYAPIHTATLQNSIKAVSLLLNSKANPNAQLIYGQTPLHFAVIQDNVSILTLLMQAKAASFPTSCDMIMLNHKIPSNSTPLSIARQLRHKLIITLLTTRNSFTQSDESDESDNEPPKKKSNKKNLD
jgi:ankyrin repeat protein